MSHFYVNFISFLRCSCPHFLPRLTDMILDTIRDQSAIFTSHPVAVRPALFICRNLLLPVKTGLKRYLTFEKKRLLKRKRGACLLLSSLFMKKKPLSAHHLPRNKQTPKQIHLGYEIFINYLLCHSQIVYIIFSIINYIISIIRII